MTRRWFNSGLDLRLKFVLPISAIVKARFQRQSVRPGKSFRFRWDRSCLRPKWIA